jgi:hypothetical protein
VALNANDGVVVKGLERPSARVGTRAAQTGDGVIDEIFNTRSLGLQVQARGRDALIK